jgi:His-Xaa-Ser system radical SAM maturase HxsC
MNTGKSSAHCFVARVTCDPTRSTLSRQDEVLVAERLPTPEELRGFRACLVTGRSDPGSHSVGVVPVVSLPPAGESLTAGDVVRVDPGQGRIRTLYRIRSSHNSLFVTERCNNNCIMCSQPPKAQDDDWMVRECFEVVRLMSRSTRQLGITGGEPTLLGVQLVELLAHCRNRLPETGLHLLSNGRLFKYLTFAEAISAVEHVDLMIAVPLYSDIAGEHDFIVQAHGAFDDTVRGILNLARCEQTIELRVVIHQNNADRLPALARFIGRNMPFVRQVALMGLEVVGHARANLAAVWADPADYAHTLVRAVDELTAYRLRPLIFNHQLCTLPCELWPFAVKSIADHKNVHFLECDRCRVRSECGGFFVSSEVRRSRAIAGIN